jgi:hypothetical protein
MKIIFSFGGGGGGGGGAWFKLEGKNPSAPPRVLYAILSLAIDTKAVYITHIKSK